MMCFYFIVAGGTVGGDLDFADEWLVVGRVVHHDDGDVGVFAGDRFWYCADC